MRQLLVALCCALLLVSAGCKKKKHKKGAAGAADTTAAAAPEAKKHDVQPFVHIEVDGSGFHPDKIWANHGEPITLEFQRTSEKTCATAVVIADEGIRQDLPLDKPVKVPLLPGRSGTIHFACPMNMYGGDITVQ